MEDIPQEPLRLTRYLFSTAIVLFVIYYVATTIRDYLKLRHIPGPPLAGWTNWWWVHRSLTGKAHLVLSDACTRYGSIARIAPNMLVTSDTDLIRKMSAPKTTTFARPAWYKAFKMDAERENLFSELREVEHQDLRHKLLPGYSGKDNPDLEPRIDEVIMSTMHLIRSKYLSVRSNIKPLDFAQLSQYLTLDVITALSLGESFGFVAEDTDKYEYIKSFSDNFPVMNFFSAVLALLSFITIPSVQSNLLPSPKDKTGLGKAKAVCREAIARRFNEEKQERHNMVISFKNHGLSEQEIADESLFQLLAGADTTATTIRTGFLSILSNPSIYARLLTEALSSTVPTSSIIPYTTAQTLPYLQACIKESLRFHPAASGLLPRIVTEKQGVVHKGVFLPYGTQLGQCAWNLHRLNPVYGDDAHCFRPERWIEAEREDDGERLGRMEEALNVVLGYGRFRCMGENIAKIELNKVFFEMIRRFQSSVVDAKRPIEVDLNYGLFLQRGMWVRVEERS